MSDPRYNSNDSDGPPYGSNEFPGSPQFRSGVDYLPYQLAFENQHDPNSQYLVPDQRFSDIYGGGTAPNSIHELSSSQAGYSEAPPIEDWREWSNELSQDVYGYNAYGQWTRLRDTTPTAAVNHRSQPTTFPTLEEQMTETVSSPKTLSQDHYQPYQGTASEPPSITPSLMSSESQPHFEPRRRKAGGRRSEGAKKRLNARRKIDRLEQGSIPRSERTYSDKRQAQRKEIYDRPRGDDNKLSTASNSELQSIYRAQRAEDDALAASGAGRVESEFEDEAN